MKKVIIYKCSTLGYSWVMKDENGKELFVKNREVIPGDNNGYTIDEIHDRIKEQFGKDVVIEFGGSCN